ncbi:hypothetical protein, partial [Paraburkholderia sediminicola]|uniref:hypothetical protein n=1 Tax=Paraburkholderia sediminicola TaxID=458836 RepID=UPI0038B98C06
IETIDQMFAQYRGTPASLTSVGLLKCGGTNGSDNCRNAMDSRNSDQVPNGTKLLRRIRERNGKSATLFHVPLMLIILFMSNM